MANDTRLTRITYHYRNGDVGADLIIDYPALPTEEIRIAIHGEQQCDGPGLHSSIRDLVRTVEADLLLMKAIRTHKHDPDGARKRFDEAVAGPPF